MCMIVADPGRRLHTCQTTGKNEHIYLQTARRFARASLRDMSMHSLSVQCAACAAQCLNTALPVEAQRITL